MSARQDARTRTTALGDSSSLKNDACGWNAHEVQSREPGRYMLEPRHTDCDTSKQQDLSLRERGMLFQNGYGFALGCNVDSVSALRNDGVVSNPRLQHQLFQRPYLTTPFVGRGPGEPDTESQLRSGFQAGEKKPCNALAEVSIDPARMQYTRYYDPQQVEHVIPPFTWGGADSRNDVRRTRYDRRCGTAR